MSSISNHFVTEIRVNVIGVKIAWKEMVPKSHVHHGWSSVMRFTVFHLSLAASSAPRQSSELYKMSFTCYYAQLFELGPHRLRRPLHCPRHQLSQNVGELHALSMTKTPSKSTSKLVQCADMCLCTRIGSESPEPAIPPRRVTVPEITFTSATTVSSSGLPQPPPSWYPRPDLNDNVHNPQNKGGN